MNITFENLTVDQANELIALAKKWEMERQVNPYPRIPIEPTTGMKPPCLVCHKYHVNLPCPSYQVTSDPF